MLQLVYTSAPKLMEAGKTGFGTIARTKDIPMPLVLFLERISTLDRQCGITGYLAYCSYKLGRSVFHIFSKVEDCGADYTGRTNHLAQHFVLEEGTAEFDRLQGATPAGVLLGLQGMWHTGAWSGGSATLPQAAAPSGIPSGTGDAWGRYTGDARNAHWLNTRKFFTGACLSGDVADPPLLLHEACMEREDHGWGLGFCTVCASNISVQRFPVQCLGAAQAQAGVTPPRGLPELEVSMGLAAPPESEVLRPRKAPEPVPAAFAPAPMSPVPAAPVPGVPAPAPPGCMPVSPHAAAQPVLPSQSPQMVTSGAPTARPPKKRAPKQQGYAILAACTFFVVLALGMVYMKFINPPRQEGASSKANVEHQAQSPSAPIEEMGEDQPVNQKDAEQDQRTRQTQKGKGQPAESQNKKQLDEQRRLAERRREVDEAMSRVLSQYQYVKNKSGVFYKSLDGEVRNIFSPLYNDVKADIGETEAAASESIKKLIQGKRKETGEKLQDLKTKANALHGRVLNITIPSIKRKADELRKNVGALKLDADADLSVIFDVEGKCKGLEKELASLDEEITNADNPQSGEEDDKQRVSQLSGKYIVCPDALVVSGKQKSMGPEAKVLVVITIREKDGIVDEKEKELKGAIIQQHLGDENIDIIYQSSGQTASKNEELNFDCPAFKKLQDVMGQEIKLEDVLDDGKWKSKRSAFLKSLKDADTRDKTEIEQLKNAGGKPNKTGKNTDRGKKDSGKKDSGKKDSGKKGKADGKKPKGEEQQPEAADEGEGNNARITELNNNIENRKARRNRFEEEAPGLRKEVEKAWNGFLEGRRNHYELRLEIKMGERDSINWNCYGFDHKIEERK